MKRAEPLAQLSRDHHLALVVARELSRADAASAGALASRFVEFLAGHELAHFALEESLLLPHVPGHEAGLAGRVLADHEYLRGAMRRLRDSPEAAGAGFLREVGERLREHVRMEERELFPLLEASLTPLELGELGADLERRR